MGSSKLLGILIALVAVTALGYAFTGEFSSVEKLVFGLSLFIGLCFYDLHKQIEKNQAATEKRLDHLFRTVRRGQGLNDED